MHIHTHKFGPEQRRFVAARSASYFDNYVFIVVGVFGNKQYFKFLGNVVESLSEILVFVLCEFADFGVFVAEHFLALREIFIGGFIFGVFIDYFLDIGTFFHEFFPLVLICDYFGFYYFLGKKLISFAGFFKFFEHNYLFLKTIILSVPP